MKSVNSLCKLCQDSDDLRVSHILPRFLGKYLKDTSATGFLTAIDTEGQPSRSQDIYKTKLLCNRCETILNETETFFARTIFHPFKQGGTVTIPIDDRLGRFAVSVSLRALWVMQLVDEPLAEKWKDKLYSLETEWRNYLLMTPNFIMGKNSHHILLCSEYLLAAGLKDNPNLLLSVMRTSAFYLFEQFGQAYVFANLAGVQIVSMISPPELPVSRGMQVYPDQTFGVDTRAGIGWGGYFQNLLKFTKELNAAGNRLSDAQKETIEQAMNKDPKRAVNSEDARILIMQQILRHDIMSKDD